MQHCMFARVKAIITYSYWTHILFICLFVCSVFDGFGYLVVYVPTTPFLTSINITSNMDAWDQCYYQTLTTWTELQFLHNSPLSLDPNLFVCRFHFYICVWFCCTHFCITLPHTHSVNTHIFIAHNTCYWISFCFHLPMDGWLCVCVCFSNRCASAAIE